MKFKQIICVTALLLCVLFTWAQKKTRQENKIVIVVKGPLPADYVSDIVELQVVPLQQDKFIYPFKKEIIQQPLIDGNTTFIIPASSPKYILPGIFSGGMGFLVEPGDSLSVQWVDQKRVFGGNAAFKFQLQKNIEYFLGDLYNPEGLSSKGDVVSSLKDYLAWSAFLDQKTKEFLTSLKSNKEKITDLAYVRFKSTVLNEIEKIRMSKFHSLRRSTIVGPVNQYGVSNEDLCKIYDTTMDNSSSRWLRFERNFITDPDYAWEMLHDENYRKRGKFFKTKESDTTILGTDPTDPYLYQYNSIKKVYNGVVRESFMVYTLASPRSVIRQVGFTPKVEAILGDYYAQSKYPNAKLMVRNFERERRTKWNSRNASEFSLTDAGGHFFNSDQLKGKIAILDFWFTGCTGCVQMAPVMRKVEEHFAKDSNIVFLGISIDKNKEQWLNSIRQGKYTSGGGIQLYTGGEGDSHDVIKRLVVESYPTLEVIDQNGLFLKYDKKKTDPRIDDGKSMIAFLEKQLAILKDGPYVFYNDDMMKALSIEGNNINQKVFTAGSPVLLPVISDQNNSFNITLKPNHNVESAIFSRPEKLFVLSDIEGNFDSFRKLLQVNKVIDENYNWTFGSGHLVFAGDMFDRGLQVTECLWLVYSLEEKAKTAGGYVHFILGNHEIMNLQGNHHYAEQKYKDNAALIGKTLTQLYNENSEIGRWLRTKNIVEKIGDILFLHGGISRKLNQLPLTIPEINQLARPNYGVANEKSEYGDERTNSIMNPKTSPFWYRNYYDDKKYMSQVIDSTLEKFEVNHIVTGHTIVADTISGWYNNKVINTDTKHAEGKSEALLIEGEKFYRVNTEGRKVLLFIDDKRTFSDRQSNQP